MSFPKTSIYLWKSLGFPIYLWPALHVLLLSNLLLFLAYVGTWGKYLPVTLVTKTLHEVSGFFQGPASWCYPWCKTFEFPNALFLVVLEWISVGVQKISLSPNMRLQLSKDPKALFVLWMVHISPNCPVHFSSYPFSKWIKSPSNLGIKHIVFWE